MNAVLTPAQQVAARTVIAEESRKRRHVVVALSGSHVFGFPSPDSDVDLKAIHLAPTTSLLGLREPHPTADRLETVLGVPIDYTSNEARLALTGILGGNGNFLERVLGPVQLLTSPELEALKDAARRSVSRRFFHHYRGFATSQRKEAIQKKTAKKLLYVLRTTLTGAHLLRTGELVIDLTALIGPAGFGDAEELLARKRTGESAPLDEGAWARWEGRIEAAFALLEAAHAASPLPAEADPGPLEAWLLEVRRAELG